MGRGGFIPLLSLDAGGFIWAALRDGMSTGGDHVEVGR